MLLGLAELLKKPVELQQHLDIVLLEDNLVLLLGVELEDLVEAEDVMVILQPRADPTEAMAQEAALGKTLVGPEAELPLVLFRI